MILPHNPPSDFAFIQKQFWYHPDDLPFSRPASERDFLFQIVPFEKQSQTGLFFEHFFPRSSERTFSLTGKNHPGFRQAVPFVLCAKRLCQVSAIRPKQGSAFLRFCPNKWRAIRLIVSGPRQTDSIGLTQSVFGGIVWVICKHA